MKSNGILSETFGFAYNDCEAKPNDKSAFTWPDVMSDMTDPGVILEELEALAVGNQTNCSGFQHKFEVIALALATIPKQQIRPVSIEVEKKMSNSLLTFGAENQEL